jgi:hypothetical protein
MDQLFNPIAESIAAEIRSMKKLLLDFSLQVSL